MEEELLGREYTSIIHTGLTKKKPMHRATSTDWHVDAFVIIGAKLGTNRGN